MMGSDARPAVSLGVSAGVLAASQYVAAGLGFVTSILVARGLGPAGYGAVTLLVAYPALVWSVTSVKSSQVTTRYLSRFRAARQHADLAGAPGEGRGHQAEAGCAERVQRGQPEKQRQAPPGGNAVQRAHDAEVGDRGAGQRRIPHDLVPPEPEAGPSA